MDGALDDFKICLLWLSIIRFVLRAIHAAIINLDGISFKDFSKFVVLKGSVYLLGQENCVRCCC